MQRVFQVFFLPFAGGSSYAFNTLINKFDPHIQAHALELPGRGTRMTEPLLKSMEEVCTDFLKQMRPKLIDGVPYVLFGHSMGALAGMLIMEQLRREQDPLPAHFFASGRGGPGAHDEEEKYYLLDDRALKDKLRELGGSPKEVLEHDTLMDFFMPILRADFEAVETHQAVPVLPFDIPLTVLTGSDEEVSPEQAALWQLVSNKPITHHVFKGDHFFLFEHEDIIARLVSNVFYI